MTSKAAVEINDDKIKELNDFERSKLMTIEMKPIERVKVERDLFVLRNWNTLTDAQQHEIAIDLALAIIGLFNKIESLEQRVRDKEN